MARHSAAGGLDRGRRRIVVLTIAIRTVAETGSTNADVLELAEAGAAEGTWLRAERQSGGRGRQGRAWDSPSGNLHASTLIRLRADDPPAPTLALVAGLALHDAVRVGVLKWPNDLLIGGAKVAGILLERSGGAVVIGFGVNVASAPSLDRPTTSLDREAVETTPDALCNRLAGQLAARVGQWRRDLAGVRSDWLVAAHPVGAPLAVNLPDGERTEGAFDGLDPHGALLLRLAGGERRVIHAGDVFQLKEG